MAAKEPRSVEVAFSTAQLEDAGIDDDEIDDITLAAIVDDHFLSFAREFAASVEEWKNEHPDE